jgi:hypothetical protein
MVVIFYDLDDQNMSLSVLKNGLGTLSYYAILQKKIQHD